MSERLRSSGIETLGDLPWGSHVCQFYETTEELLEIMLPWFAEGLRSNELCVWVVSDPIPVERALTALGSAVPGLSSYIAGGRMKVLRHDQWYLEGGSFSAERVLSGWAALLEDAAWAGLDGLRVAGDTSWVDGGLRASFAEYERSVQRLVRGKKILAVCTYPSSSVMLAHAAETVSSHSAALVKKGGRWSAARRDELAAEAEEAEDRRQRSRLVSGLTTEFVFRLEIAAGGELGLEWITRGLYDSSGYGAAEIGTLEKFQSVIHPVSLAAFKGAVQRALSGGRTEAEIMYRASSGAFRWLSVRMVPEHHQGTRIIKGVIGIGTDTTGRKTAEQRAIEAERRYAGLCEATSDGVVRVGPDGTIAGCNPAFASMLGYKAGEMAGMPWAGLAAPEDDGPAGAMPGEGPAACEKVFVAGDGRTVAARVRAFALNDADNRPDGFWAVVRDLTPEKEARREISTGESLLKGLISSLPGTFYVIDREGRMLRWNRALEEITGYSGEEIGRMNAVEFFCASNRRLIREKIEDAFIYGAAEVEAELVTSEGEKIPFHFRGVLTRIDGAQCVVGTGTDISRWKGAEQALKDAMAELEARVAERTRELVGTNSLLRKSEERFRALVETTSDWVWEVDAKGVYTYASPKITEVLGYKPEEVLGRTPFDLMPADEAHRIGSVFKKIAALKRPFAMLENRNTHKDGHEVVLETSGTPILDASGNLLGYRGIDRNVTVRKRQESERSRIQDQMIHSQKIEAIGVLAGGIAHDFNNLMVIIRLNNSMALKRTGDDEIAQYLEQINAASERAENLTRQLLIFSRRQPTEPRALDLNRKVGGVLGMLRRLIGENILIDTCLSPDIGKIRADKGNIEQIIMNLVINARDAMPGGGRISIGTGMVDVGSSSRAVSQGSHVKLTVSDSGEGMDAVVIRRIFEPFFTTKGPRGTGLGLAVVHDIVSELGGWVDVESRPGGGTTFELYFPATEDDGDDAPAEEPATEGLTGNGECVLVVEDEKLLRKSVSVALSRNGYTVLEADCAREAEALFAREKDRVDLVFCDMVLHDGDGIRLMEGLRRVCPGLRALMTSGYLDVESQWPALREKRYGFLQKPYEVPALLTAVREALGRDA